MQTQKAYKLLAEQLGVSNNEAKTLIDNGLVSTGGKRLEIARAELPLGTKFSVTKRQKPRKIFEDENLVAVEKPPFVTSEEVAKEFGFALLNRLDKETSGVMLLYKSEEFRQNAVAEFAANRVEKLYYAIVKGVVAEEFEITAPLTTTKTKGGAFTRVDKHGKSAFTRVLPQSVSGKKSLVKVQIQTGRTHQIRVHLASAGFGVLGDEKYAKSKAKRIYLHSAKISLLGYSFESKLDQSFAEFFEI